MSATFDATTTSEYATATTAAARSAVIVAALSGTISVKVFDGSNVEKGSGTMAAPWATASGDTVTVGEVSSFTVGATGTPDANWYIRFQNAGATRWVRGSFGLVGSGQDFTWSLATWTAAQTGTIGTATIITTGNTAPVFTVAPTSSSLPKTGGTIQFSAEDPDGGSIIYSLSARSGFTINSTTGLVTVTSAAAGTSGNITVTASDGILTTTATCSVTVAGTGAGAADFIIPVSTTARVISNASTTAYTGKTWASLATGSKTQPGPGDIIEFAAGTHGEVELQISGTSAGDVTVRANQSARSILSAAATWVFTLRNCTYLTIDGGVIGSNYGFLFTQPNSGSGSEHIVKCKGINHHITLRNFEVDGKISNWTGSPAVATPIGMGMHDNSEKLTANPNVFQHDILIENFYVHNVAGEGVYAGSNWQTQAVPIKDITIRNGVVEDTGRDGVQGKAWYEGTNLIENVTCRRVGRNTPDAQAGQLLGIDIASGQGTIRNCKVYDSGEAGIRGYVDDGPYYNRAFNGHGPYTQFVVEIYNCLVVRAGRSTSSNATPGNGIVINCSAPSTTEPSYQTGDVVVPLLGKVYSSTVYGCSAAGINFGSLAASGGFVMNCISTGNGTNLSLRSGTTNLGNYTTATFQNALASNPLNSSYSTSDDYHLTAAKAAYASSTLGTNLASTDLDGDVRALATADAGAYEYP